MNTAPDHLLIVEPETIDLGTMTRGEIRTIRVSVRGDAGLAGSVAVDPAFTHAVKPRRTAFQGPTDVEVVVFTHPWTEASEVEVPLSVTSNGGDATIRLRFGVRPRPAALSVLERRIDAVFRRRAPGWVEARIRNDGDRPLPLTVEPTEPWLNVEAPRELAPGQSVDLRITIDARSMPDDCVRHRRKGDRYAVAGVRINGEDRIEVRAWVVRTWDPRAFCFGLVAGCIPFVNVLMGAVLAADRFRATDSRARRGYRAYSEQREGAWFMLGLVPGLALSVLTFLNVV